MLTHTISLTPLYERCYTITQQLLNLFLVQCRSGSNILQLSGNLNVGVQNDW